MKSLALALSLALFATGAVAQTRPSTTAMTCRAASALLASQGAVVLATGRDLYDRYVTGPNFCGPGEDTRASFEPTADNPQCFIGYRCVATSREMR